jgi:hypothetical protein
VTEVDKARVVPVDDFVTGELYPGYKQEFGSQPFVAGPVRPFAVADNARYWLRDSLHFSEGMVPASIATLDDAQTWGAQLGAEIVGVPRPGDRSTGSPGPTSTSAPSTSTPTGRCRREKAGEIEAAEGAAQDAEWAIAKHLPFPDSVFFLQHRPETSWSTPPEAVPRQSARSVRDDDGFDPVKYALRNVFKVPGT